MIYAATFELRIENAQSLKDKRAVLQRVISRTKQRFNVSISETDFQDQWQRTEICVVTVTSSKHTSQQSIQAVLDFVDSFPEVIRTATVLEWL